MLTRVTWHVNTCTSVRKNMYLIWYVNTRYLACYHMQFGMLTSVLWYANICNLVMLTRVIYVNTCTLLVKHV